MPVKTKFVFIFILISLFIIYSSSFGFSIVSVSAGQRTDGSKLWDIHYSIEGVHDCVDIGLMAITESGEVLTCTTFVDPSDTGTICSSGNYHIIWDFGHDVPGREFYTDMIKIRLWAAKPGIVPGVCGCGTCVDIDGNSYETIQIGTQCWMAENLKVTHYRDGTAIPNVTDATEWSNLDDTETGAYCEYNNDPFNVPTYGRLYNWYAVDDARGFAPVGWHVPTDDEWQILVDYLGVSSVAGGKMKEAGLEHWASPNTGATNESGFTALPGGYRGYDGTFRYMSLYALFWSSSEYSTAGAWGRYLGYINTDVLRDYIGKRNGFSVRCLRD